MATSVMPGAPATFEYPMPSGAVSSIVATVRDETDVVVDTFAVGIPGPEALEFSVTVLGSKNLVSGLRGARTVFVEVFHADGVDSHVTEYLIEGPIQLVPLENSFVTYTGAMMTRGDLASTDGWDAAEKDERIAALKLAYSAMVNLRYRFRTSEADGWNRVTDSPVIKSGYGGFSDYQYVGDISEISAQDWAALPQRFRTAIARAQVAEADYRLLRGGAEAKRAQGIVSETIGESSMFFKQSPDVRMALCREALTHLNGMIIRRTLMGRGS